jgi:hypothetical protein
MYQGLEGIGAIPHGRVSVGPDNGMQLGIAGCQLIAEGLEVMGGECVVHLFKKKDNPARSRTVSLTLKYKS